MRPLLAFWRLLREAPRGRLIALLVLMILASLSEGIGLLLLVPLLGVLDEVGGAASGVGAAGAAGAAGAIGSVGIGDDGDASGNNPLVTLLLDALSGLGLAPTIGGLLLAFLGMVALRAVVQYGRERLSVSLQHQLVDRLRLRAYRALLGVEWRWIAASRRADQANLLLTDISRVGMGLQFGIGLLAAGVTLLAYLTAALALSWSMTALALVSGGLVFGLLSRQRRHALALGRTLGAANRDLHGTVQESLAGIKLTKILGQEGRHLEQFRQTLARVREQQVGFAASTSLSRAFFQIAGAALLAGYLYLGLVVWRTPVPELLTLVLIFSRVIPLFMSAQQQLHHWLHALPALEETERLLADCRAAAEPALDSDLAPEPKPTPTPKTGRMHASDLAIASSAKTPSGHPAQSPVLSSGQSPSQPADEPCAQSWPVREAIELDRVQLTYSERDTPALDGISLRLPARTSTAIMGASGAGKSTLADVLMGLLEPDQGQLKIDGEPITGARRRSWRRAVAYVPQEVFLFNDSIRNNLRWGAAGASDEALRLALQRAAADFVFALPEGLETRVGDGGVRLSGGERQRLALARALLKQPSLLILDEATSALDRENEARVRAAIEQLHGDLTLVVIGHRLATLEHADQVVVLEAGRVAACGTWASVRSQVNEGQI